MKYVLVVSQYYHSLHTYICAVKKEDFLDNIKEFVEELQGYKSDDNVKEREMKNVDEWIQYYKGNFDIEKVRRMNYNGQGDIYLIFANYTNRLKCEAVDFALDYRKQANSGYKKKSVLMDIEKHHEEYAVYNIVKKHFEIV